MAVSRDGAEELALADLVRTELLEQLRDVVVGHLQLVPVQNQKCFHRDRSGPLVAVDECLRSAMKKPYAAAFSGIVGYASSPNALCCGIKTAADTWL